jgi:hypothetical protein
MFVQLFYEIGCNAGIQSGILLVCENIMTPPNFLCKTSKLQDKMLFVFLFGTEEHDSEMK